MIANLGLTQSGGTNPTASKESSFVSSRTLSNTFNNNADKDCMDLGKPILLFAMRVSISVH